METTINNADDFDLHKTLNAENWRALRRLGADTNARFLAALGEGQAGLPDPATLESRRPAQRRMTASAPPALRFGEPRTMALLASIAAFDHVIGGLTNKALRAHMADLWDTRLQPRPSHLRPAPPPPQRLHRTHPRTPTPTGSPPTACASPPSSPNSPPESIVPALTDLASLLRPRPPAPRPLTTAWQSLRTRTHQPPTRQPTRSMTQKLASIIQNQGLKRS